MILLPLFAVALPASTEVVYKLIFKIVSFEVIPSEEAFKGMSEKLEDVSPPDDPQIEKYGRILGINSVWLLPSLGALLLFMGLYPLMLVLLLLLILLS